MRDKLNSVFQNVIVPIGTAIIVSLILKSFLFLSVTYGNSMYPTVVEGSFSLGLRHPKEVNKQDIVILPLEDKRIVKRVIATEGDKVEIINGTVYINDAELLDTHYALRDNTDYGPITVPQGEIFFLGDNRAVSLDSRDLGTYKVDDVIARIYWNIGLQKL